MKNETIKISLTLDYARGRVGNHYFFKENQNPSPWVISLLIYDSPGIRV